MSAPTLPLARSQLRCPGPGPMPWRDGPACRDFLAGSGAAGARRLREDPAARDIRIRVFEPGRATAMFLGATRGPEVVRRAT
jgi:hypothetical protein